MDAPASLRQRLRVTRLISVALASGLLIFLAVVFLSSRPPEVGPRSDAATLMTLMAAGAWAIGLVAGSILFQRQVSPAALALLVSGRDDPAAALLVFPRLQVACLTRWAMLEGPALFGAVVILLHRADLNGQPILSVNLVLVLLSIALILFTAPGEAWLRERVRLARGYASHRTR